MKYNIAELKPNTLILSANINWQNIAIKRKGCSNLSTKQNPKICYLLEIYLQPRNS